MRILLLLLALTLGLPVFAQTGRPPVVLNTVADAVAREARLGEEIFIRNYSTNVPWSEPRSFVARTNAATHDGVHYLTNAHNNYILWSTDRIAPVQRPEWYGAAVDDGLDDSAAIKAALNQGATVQLSSGVYNVAGNVTNGTSITIPSNRSLRGVPGTKIAVTRGDGTYSAQGIRIASVTNVVVAGIEVYASPAVTNISQATYGVMVLSTSGGQSRDILIEDCIGHDLSAGFDVAGSGVAPVVNSTLSRCIAYDCVNNGAQAVYCEGLKVLDCEFYSNGGSGGAGYGFDLETNSGEYTSNVIFARNRAYSNLSGGLAAVSGMGPGGTNLAFVENVLWDNPIGINVNGQSTNRYNGVTLSGNQFRGNSVRGFSVSRANRVKIVENTSDGDDSNSILETSFVDIDGNTFRNSTNEALEISSAATSQGVNIRGNTMLNAGGRGINAQNLVQSLISGNVIQSPGEDGIAVTGSDTVIANNHILGAGRSAEGTYVGLSVSGTRNSVSGNFIRKFFGFDYGYAQAGASNTITLASNAVGTDDYHTNAWVGIVQGTGAGQVRQISDYNGSTKVATVSTNWTTDPTTNSVYQIGAYETTTVSGTPTAVSSTSVTLDTWASATSQRYTGGFIRVSAGTGSGQERLITAYSTGREATIDTAWGVTPDTNSTLVVVVPKGTWRGFVVVGDSHVAENNSFVHGGMSTDFLDAGSGTALSPKFISATAAPTFGTYRAGDITYNSDPDAGEPLYWACSVSGDPGTWLAAPVFGSGSGGSLPSGSLGDLLVNDGANWSTLTVGTNGTYLAGGTSPNYRPLNTDNVIIDGRSEALNEMLNVDVGENITFQPYRNGLATSLLLRGARGTNSMRIDWDTVRTYAYGVEVARVGSDGLKIQPAGISGNPSYALDVVGTTSLDGNVTIGSGDSVTFGGETRTNWPSAGTTLPTATLGSLLYGDGTNWVALGVGSTSDYLRVSGGVPDWEALTTARVTIDGRSEALSEMLLVDGSENIYLRPHRGGGLSTSLYFEALRGGTSMRLTYDVQRMFVSGTETLRLSADGLRIQPAGVSASASYALDVVGSTYLNGSVLIGVTNVITELAGKQPLDADLTAFAAGTAIPTAQTNAISWSAPLLYVGTTNVAFALANKQPYDTRLQEIANISWQTGDMLYFNGSILTDRAIGTNGQVLTVDSGVPTWATPGAGSGTVTSVGLTVPSGFSVSGSPVTTSGTLAITGTLATSAGGTGITNMTAAGQALMQAVDEVDQLTVLTLISATPTPIDSVARTTVRKNSGAEIGSRRRLNFIEGTNVSLAITDDAGNEELDIIVNASATGGTNGSTFTTNYLTVPLFTANTTNVVASDNTTETNILTSIDSWGSTNIALGTLASGSTLRLRAGGTFSATGNWNDGTFRFKVGGLTISATFDDPESYGPFSNKPWALDATLLVQSAGSSATVAVSGGLTYEYVGVAATLSGVATVRPLSFSGTLDTTTNNTVGLTFQNTSGQEITLVRNTATLEWVGKQTILGGGSGSGGGTTNLVSTSTNGLVPQITASNAVFTASATGVPEWKALNKQIASWTALENNPGTNASTAALFALRGDGIPALTFTHNAAQEANFTTWIPSGFDLSNGLDLTLAAYSEVNSSTSNVVYQVDLMRLCCTGSGALDTNLFVTSGAVTSTLPTTVSVPTNLVISMPTLTNIAAGNFIRARVTRVVGSASDDHTNRVGVIAAKLEAR